MNRRIVVLAATVGACLLLVMVPRGQVSAPSLEKTIQPIFDANCTTCHGADTQRARLDLSPGHSYAALVGVPSTEVETLQRVKPGDPENSYLMQKVLHTASQGKGMPRGFLGSSSLDPKEIEAIRAWIASGAKP